MKEMIYAIKHEIEFFGKYNSSFFDQKDEIQTIYFGGGTPSILHPDELSEIIETIFKNYNIVQNPEITIEANPDNLSLEYCQNLKKLSFNRLSIGIQSFFDEHLKWMNRSHNSKQAITCIENAHLAGFDNINIDLIYGLPGLTDEQWKCNLDLAQKLKINHLSCYSLTVEENTPLKKLIQTSRYIAPDENNSVSQFRYLQNWAEIAEWEHYEISNLCKGGFYSKHNCSYWNDEKYLGIGPSAHSYNKTVRRWNVADNKKYIENMNINVPEYNTETLTIKEKYNDYILTSLRTKWGIDIIKANEISDENFNDLNSEVIKKYQELKYILSENEHLKLSKEGMLFADKIASDLFLI